MRPFFSDSALPLLLLFLFFSSSSLTPYPAAMASIAVPTSDDTDTVQQACHMAWQDGSPQYEPCVSALGSSQSSRNATLVDLAVLSTDFATRDASAVLKRMQELEAGDAGGATYQLAECMAKYRKSISTMEGCRQDIQAGHYGAAGYSLVSALDGTACGEYLVGASEESVKEKLQEVTVLVGVAKAICYKYCRESDTHETDCLF